MSRYIGIAAIWLVLGGFGAAPKHHYVVQQDRRFSHEELTIQRADSVVFQNDDTVVHNPFSTSANNRFNLRPQKPGTASVVVFLAPGQVVVRCAFHPQMTLVVTVE